MRSDSEIADRLCQLAQDHQKCVAERHPMRREFALRQYVLSAKMNPEQADKLTAEPGYSFDMRCAAIMEAQWLHGYRNDPWA